MVIPLDRAGRAAVVTARRDTFRSDNSGLVDIKSVASRYFCTMNTADTLTVRAWTLARGCIGVYARAAASHRVTALACVT